MAIRLDLKKLFNQAQFNGVLNDYCTIKTTLLLKKRGAELRLILGEGEIESTPDKTIITLLAKTYDWKQRWLSKSDCELKSIIREDGLAPTGYSREIRLAFLAPDIVDAFMTGSAPIELTAEHLKRLKNIPADWNEQRAMLGFSDRTTKQ